MVVVDTSVWIDVWRDRRGTKRAVLAEAVGDEDVVLTRFQQLELLQGARDEREWAMLGGYLDAQDYLEASSESWSGAARLYFELRRRGATVRSPIDCCIAQIAMEHGALLLHRDKDFETIAAIRPLQQVRLVW